MPGIASVRVLRRSRSDGVERLLLEQRGEFRWLVFAQPVTVRMDVVQQPPNRVDAHAVPAAGADAAHLESFEGRYELAAAGDGVRLHYVARIVPRFTLPPVIGELALRQTVRTQFEAMLAEIERRAAADIERGTP